MELLNPERRAAVDAEIAAHEEEEAVAEFHKYLAFAITDGVLPAAQEKSLVQFGAQHGLSVDKMQALIEAELADSGAKRAAPPPAAAPSGDRVRTRARRRGSLDPKEDFNRMLRLSGLDGDSMTDDQRDAFINIAENLGLDVEEAEDMVDAYLNEFEDDAKRRRRSPRRKSQRRTNRLRPRPRRKRRKRRRSDRLLIRRRSERSSLTTRIHWAGPCCLCPPLNLPWVRTQWKRRLTKSR